MIKERYHHGALREAIIQEAFAQLEEGGLDSLSLREIAGRAGVSKNAPYRHFKNKEELLTVLAADGFRELADRLESVSGTAADGSNAVVAGDSLRGALSNLRAMFNAYIDFARRRPACYNLMFSTFGYSLHSEACRTNSMRAFNFLVHGITRAQAKGWRQGESVEGLVFLVWSTLHGWALIRNQDLAPEEAKERVSGLHLEEILFGGQ